MLPGLFRPKMLLCLIILHAGTSLARPGPEHQLFLLANTADMDLKDAERIVRVISGAVINPEQSTLLINGDLTDDPGSDTLILHKLLLNISDHISRVFILPGDRDWAHSGPGGYRQLQDLQKVVRKWKLSNVIWAVDDGCPGPAEYLLNDHSVLITFDTQWFNHPYRKPEPADGICKIITEADFFEELEDLIDDNPDRNILLAGHYPVFSLGKYGGRFPFSDFVLPVPVVSGMITAFHQNVGDAGDIGNNRFSSFRSKMINMLQEYGSIIYLSGHEKNQQIIARDENILINSGAPVQGDFVDDDNTALFETSGAGVMEIRFFPSGNIDARFHDLTGKDNHTDDIALFESACVPGDSGRPENHGFVPCQEKQTFTEKMTGSYPAAVLTKAGPQYDLGRFGRFWLGGHYRDTWTTEISTEYLNLDTAHQGLVPFEKGGGRQTMSLKFTAGDSREYVFRSVDKDPSKALSYELRETLIADVLRDQTTTQQPYGAIAVDALLNHTRILHAHPVLYVMPDDGKLGVYREAFGNMLGMLEDRPVESDDPEISFGKADDILKSHKLFRDLYDDHDNRIHKEEFLQARVIDMLIGDWGKHEDNWKWAGYKTEDGFLYRPIPRDRDHAFSRWDGVLPWLADREWAKPSGENFGYSIRGLRSLMWQARHLDRLLANESSRQDWIKAAESLQQILSDTLIHNAVTTMPQETYDVSGREIESKLKARRHDLPEYAGRYYDILAKQVDVVGSNKNEYFEARRNEDGTVEIWMFDVDKGLKDEGEQFYYRRFFPEETQEIRLFGLDGKDNIVINGHARKSILIRAVGGPGNDSIADRSEVRGPVKHTRIYETDPGSTVITGNEGKRVRIPYPPAYHYDRTAFTYNTYLPTPYIAYSADNGFILNLGIQFTRQRYGKPDYALKHDIQASVSTLGNFTLDYSAKFHHVLGKWDLQAGGGIGKPARFNYFFGVGNETTKSDSLFDSRYYRINYDSYYADLSLIREFWNRSYFSAGIEYQNNKTNVEEGKILDDPALGDVFGKEPVNLVQGNFILNFDFKDNQHIPRKGMQFYLQHKNGFVTSEDNTHFSQTAVFLEQYVSNHWENPLTFGLRIGGSHNNGLVPFYNLSYLGQRNNLRGFLKHRFTGDWIAYLNSNLGIQITEVHTSIIPLKIGLHGFFDTGRVWTEGERSSKWHMGYGGGFYVVPLREQFVLYLAVGMSEEEKGLILFNLGRFF